MPETGEDLQPFNPYTQETLYDRLNKQRISWRVYFSGVPQSLALVRQLHRDNVLRYCRFEEFVGHVHGPVEDFPQYTFIEPQYFGRDANDDHPPHDTMRAQALIAEVYNALRHNDMLWKSTLLVILYDEHGGFYDHVQPPRAIPPDHHKDEYEFDRLGVRVPALLVSPWVAKGVVSTRFDHTSLIQYLTKKWGLGPLGDRVAQAESIGKAIRHAADYRAQTLRRIDTAIRSFGAVVARAKPEVLNEHQKALLALSEYLESKIEEDPSKKADRRVRAMAAPASVGEVAAERVSREALNK